MNRQETCEEREEYGMQQRFAAELCCCSYMICVLTTRPPDAQL